jgi:hypothetical protein
MSRLDSDADEAPRLSVALRADDDTRYQQIRRSTDD